MTSESAETDGSQQTAEISTRRGTVRGVLYPVEHSRGAVLMVGARAATPLGLRASTTSWLPTCSPKAQKPSVSNTARRTNSTNAYTTFSLVSLRSREREGDGRRPPEVPEQV